MSYVGRGLWFLLGLVLVLMFGCAHAQQFRAREGQEIAVHVIWTEVYGRTDRPPLVRWIEGSALDCTDPNSGKPGFHTPGLGCREGRTMSHLEVACAWQGTELSFAETTLAHELLHAALLRNGIIDAKHSLPVWQAGGVVDMANQRVQEAGR